MSHRFHPLPALFSVVTLVALAGCGDVKPSDQPYYNPNEEVVNLPQQSSVFGTGGIPGLFGGGDQRRQPGPGAAGIGVNLYLWRASLDTISFLPITSADPFGGVIITDWYSPPESPNERFKLNLFILDKELRTESIKATVFRQTQTNDGRWIDAAVDPKTAADFENAVLTRARQLKVANAQQAAQN